jgi:hypothetical protein
MSYGANDPNGLPLGLPSILSLGLPPLVNPYPALNLDFIDNQTLDSRVTFSRGSQATLFDSTGTLKYAKHNLVLQSQTFQTTWTVTRSSISADATVAPDGTLTSDKLVEDTTASNTHFISQNLTTAVSAYTFSVYLKAAGRNFGRLILSDGTSFFTAYFDLSTGTVGTVSGTGATAAITSVGNGWYRCSVSATTVASSAGGANVNIRTATANGTDIYTGNGTSGFFIWGAQLNIANMEGGVTSSLTTYYPTTTAAYYAARFDYNPSTLQPLGLLIEEQRTNSIRNNTMVGAVAGTPGTLPTNWGTTLSGLSQTVVSTGTENGINYIDLRLFGTTTSTFVLVATEVANNIVASSGQTWTASSYVKLVAGSLANITSINSTVSGRDATNPITTQTESTSTPFTPTSAALSTQRYSATRALNNASTGFVTQFVTILCASGAAIDITLRIGLPQLELGAFATSVIPTTTTALTRNADVASMTGTNFSSWYNASEGTLYVEAQLQGVGGLAPAALVSIDDVTTNNRIILRRSLVAGTANFRFVSSAGSIDANLLSGSNTGLNKMIAAFKAGDQQSANNGTLFTGITPVASLPIVTRLAIGDGPGSTPASGTIRRIAYYPTRLPNSTLQALTA